MGGTWKGLYEGCVGADARIEEAELYPYAEAFERIVHNVRNCGMTGDDRGWLAPGESLSSWNCWSGQPRYQNGIEVANLRQMLFAGQSYDNYSHSCRGEWHERVMARRDRSLECPVGYTQRYRNGVQECFKPVDACPTAGNPIKIASGAKVLQQIDYPAVGASSLQLTRHYHSHGFYRPLGSTEVEGRPTDYWRTNYDRRIYPLDSPAAIASMQRPDGTVRFFAPSGEAIHAAGGRQDRLEPILAGDKRTGWRYRVGDGSVERYTAEGRLASITHRGGATETLAYDEYGRLLSVTEESGRSLRFEYDGQGRLSRAVAPGGAAVAYGYDEAGRLATVTYADGSTRTYLYEDARHAHALTGLLDENGHRFATWTYDNRGRAVSREHAGGAGRTRLEFVNAETTRVTDPTGTVRTYRFQAINGELKLVSVEGGPCDSCGATAQAQTYDANGFLASKTDWNGVTTTYRRDAQGREVSRTEAAGTAQARTLTTDWHPQFSLPVQVTEPGRTTTYGYDEAGNRLEQTVQDSVTGARRSLRYTYDQRGLLLAVDGPRDDVADLTRYEYDAQGNRTAVINALGHTTRITAHDAAGRPLEVLDANGLVTRLAYDTRGRLVLRDAGGELTRFTYDGAGNLTRVEQPDGSLTDFSYDAAHRLIALQDGAGNRIDYTLDAAGNRLQEDVRDRTGPLCVPAANCMTA